MAERNKQNGVKKEKDDSQNKNTKPSKDKKSVLEMNLAEGEIIHYFSWKKAFSSFVFSAILAFTILFFVYLGLSWWGEQRAEQNKFFSEKSEQLESQIENTREETEFLLIFKKKMEIINNELLPEHIYWTNFFDYLEENTLDQVGYSHFSGAIDGSYSLPVTTKDYNIINSQVELMRENSLTEEARVRSAAKNKESEEESKEKDSEVTFDLELKVSEEIFTKNK